MHKFQDAFISYGRADSKQFAKRLNDRLVEAGLEVWFDFDDIPLGVDYQNQINDGIEKADNFVFIISPHSVNSDYCAKEIELALKLNKRIIPLLHVEEISLETWQQRHPYDQAADWEAYRDQGLHSSFPNMHPEISKINWVYFREELDDFEAGVVGLRSILARQQRYVRQHTLLLDKALEWQQHQRQSTYLLTADALAEADTWLHTRFKEEQPPCLPTELHCEFITESLKGADDQMTQIFVSYSEEDIEIQEKIRKRLVREGFTVWINTQDIQTAEDFQGAINRGIEKANTIVLLLSPNSLASKYCRQEIDYGRKYHKRIIPLLVKHTDLDTLPDDLRTLQFIDFSTLASETHFDRAVDELIRALGEAADYADRHKRILVKALAWERQGRDRKFLLRGTAFTEAQAWLAQPVPVNLTPTDLHETYLQASQGGNQFYDAFISYGRADSKVFATQLDQRLREQGLQVWFDQNDIPMGVDYQQQIDDGIEKSHTFLFVIAPHSVNSPYCAKEIELAVRLNKRILPILHVEEISYSTWKSRNPGKSRDDWQRYKSQGKHASEPNLHPNISKINWIKARQEIDDVEAALAELVELIHRHEGYVQQHTEFLIRALAWDRHQRQTSYLLMGEERLNAQVWLTKQFEHEQPPCLPTALHAEFITESTKAADGGMTQVFISYAQENRQVKEQVQRHLLQAGITVWADTVDIHTGEDFEVAIQRGVEEADNIVYLISKPALMSAYCQQEIEQALALNKRIIPILLEELDLSQLSEEVKTIQFINLADNQVSLDLEEDLAKLLRTIRQEAPYYGQHKQLLVRALKWQQQKQNPSLLLRRQALKKYTAWAQIAKDRPLHKALPLQLQFLAASQAQPPEQTLGVFISHHVDDIDFSQRLNETLLIQGKSTWFTPGGAEADTDTPQDTQQAIDNAENFVFLLSPSSVRAKACLAELAYAQSRQKRIVPVIYRNVLKSTLPEDIELIPWSDFRQHDGDFLVNFGELFRTLESDPEHVRSHTRLLVKATEWDAANRDDSFLLRGKDLSESEQWLRQSANKVPQPADLQRDYIQTSQALPFKKIKLRSVAITTVLTTLAVSAVRLLGGLQPLEARVYDQFLRLRPSETAQDQRLLIVEVDSPSGQWLREQTINGPYDPGLGTIPEKALDEALEILDRHDARLIGLDFFRDFPSEGALTQRLTQTNNLFGICQTASQDVGDIPNQDIPPAQVGFGNLLLDGSKIVRRHALDQGSSNRCPSNESFSLLMARTYLESEGIAYQGPYDEATEKYTVLRLGEVSVPNLTGNGMVYTGMSEQWGWSNIVSYQTLLNFRTYRGSLKDFAQRVSLDALLRNEVSPELIRDRIVLIGYTDFSDRNSDDFNTPYKDSIPGVYLHGQMISQLINAALEDRPLIRWWPIWGEMGWILLWSGVGGLVFWGLVRPGRVLAASLGAVGLLTLACYGFLVGPVVWVPWVPALLGGGITGGAVGYMTYRLRKG